MSKIQDAFPARGRALFESEKGDAEAFNAKYAGRDRSEPGAPTPKSQSKEMEMDAYSIGVERHLAAVSAAVAACDGAGLAQGVDRLAARAYQSVELAQAMPMLFAEAVQDGFAMAWREAFEANPAHPAYWVGHERRCAQLALCDDSFGPDEMGKIFLGEAARLMATSAARAFGQCAALGAEATHKDCVAHGSSFLGALSYYNHASRLAPVAGEVVEAIGQMMRAWGIDIDDMASWERLGVPSIEQFVKELRRSALEAALSAAAAPAADEEVARPGRVGPRH
jgi:hypothetical protein